MDEVKKQEDYTLWFKLSNGSRSYMYINAVANGAVLYLWYVYDVVFKCKRKWYKVSESSLYVKNSWCMPGLNWNLKQQIWTKIIIRQQVSTTDIVNQYSLIKLFKQHVVTPPCHLQGWPNKANVTLQNTLNI